MEKWLQSKGNPYLGKRTGTLPKRVSSKRTPPHHRAFGHHTKLHRAHYGKPIQLFKDSDKDGVANVFDCKPFNKRKQDIISPMSGSNPMMDMYNRQEWARQQRLLQKQMEEAKRLEEQRLSVEEQRLAEIQRINTPTISIEGTSFTPTIYNPETKQWVRMDSQVGKELVQKMKNETTGNEPADKRMSIAPTAKESLYNKLGINKAPVYIGKTTKSTTTVKKTSGGGGR